MVKQTNKKVFNDGENMGNDIEDNGLVWLVVDKAVARNIYKAGKHELYQLYRGAEILIEDDHGFERALNIGLPFAIKIDEQRISLLDIF